MGPAGSIRLQLLRDTTMDASDSEIRPVRAADAEAWRALRLQALKDDSAAFTSSYEEEAALDPEAFARRIPSGNGADVLFGLFVEGALQGAAGFAVFKGLKLRHKGLLWGVYVRPQWRGRGFAKALVARVIEQARTRVAVLQAGVMAGNNPARSTYLSLGFEPYGLERAALRVNGVDIDEELLWIDFRPAALPAPGLSDRRAP